MSVMHFAPKRGTEIAGRDLANAILRLWGQSGALDVTRIALNSYHDVMKRERPYSDANAMAAMLQISIDKAAQGIRMDATELARNDLVRALLHNWFRVPPWLKSRTMAAAHELSILKGEDPDQAVFRIRQMTVSGRPYQAHFDKVREKLLQGQRERQRARAAEALYMTQERLKREEAMRV